MPLLARQLAAIHAGNLRILRKVQPMPVSLRALARADLLEREAVEVVRRAVIGGHMRHAEDRGLLEVLSGMLHSTRYGAQQALRRRHGAEYARQLLAVHDRLREVSRGTDRREAHRPVLQRLP